MPSSEILKRKVLVVDDKQDVLELLKKILERENYTVILASSTEEALEEVRQTKPDLVILDLRLPTIGGLEVCRILKSGEDTKLIPIIMLTALSTDIEKVMGLEMGADDYVTKPFSQAELIARVKAVFRRIDYTATPEKILKSEKITMNLDEYTVFIDEKPIRLLPKEFDLLYLFIEKKGAVLRRDFLTIRVWGYEYFGTTRTVDVTVNRLRKKLGPEGKRIETVIGVGYKFTDEEDVEEETDKKN